MLDLTPELSAADDLLALLRVVADPKEHQARLDRLTAATTKAREARATAERADAALAKRVAELDRREAALDAERSRLADRAAAVKERHAELSTVSASLQRLDHVLRMRIATHAGMLEGFDESMVPCPQWSEIDERISALDGTVPELPIEAISQPARRISAH